MELAEHAWDLKCQSVRNWERGYIHHSLWIPVDPDIPSHCGPLNLVPFLVVDVLSVGRIENVYV